MLTRDQKKLAKRIATSRNMTFMELTKLAMLRPERDFRYARLVDIDFGACDLTGYDFSGADLTNADLSATPPPGPLLAGATTIGAKIPATFDAARASQAVAAAIARPTQRGPTAYGSDLRDDIEKLMRLAGWRVNAGQGKRPDLMCIREDTLGPRRVAVDIIDWRTSVTASKASQIIADYTPALTANYIDQALIVSQTKASGKAMRLFEVNKKILFVTVNEFLSRHLDLRRYLTALCTRHENDGLLNQFVPLRARRERNARVKSRSFDAMSHLENWVDKDNDNTLFVGGAYGFGKSTLARQFAYTMARRYLLEGQGRIPIYLAMSSLRQSLFELVNEFFTTQNQIPAYSYTMFEWLNRLGLFVIIIDELDAVRHRGFWLELASLHDGKSKVLCLGRSPAQTQEESFVIGNAEELRSEAMNYPIIWLDQFSKTDVVDLVRKHMAGQHTSSGAALERYDAVLGEMRGVLGEMELLRRPLFARVVADLLVNAHDPIESVTNYSLFDALLWIVLDRERVKYGAPLSPVRTRDTLRSLAWQSWTRGKTIGLGIDKLANDFVEKAAQHVGGDTDSLPCIAGSALFRIVGDGLEFAHRAFQEFLVAEHVTRYITSSSFDEDEFIAIVPFITEEIVGFIATSHEKRVLQRIASIVAKDPTRFPPYFVKSFV